MANIHQIHNEIREIVFRTLRDEGYYPFVHEGELIKVWKDNEAEVLLGHFDLGERITAVKSKTVVRLLYKVKEGEQTQYKAYIYYPDQNNLVEFFTVNCQKKGGALWNNI